jgi:hypothetical protein
MGERAEAQLCSLRTLAGSARQSRSARVRDSARAISSTAAAGSAAGRNGDALLKGWRAGIETEDVGER